MLWFSLEILKTIVHAVLPRGSQMPGHGLALTAGHEPCAQENRKVISREMRVLHTAVGYPILGDFNLEFIRVPTHLQPKVSFRT